MTRSFKVHVSAPSFIKDGGTSSQFLKADGSVDASTYLTTSVASSTYAPIASPTHTGTVTGPIFVATGGDGSNAGFQSTGYNQRGGTGYHGFLQATNTYVSATNATKHFRINSTGALEIVNSGYTAAIFNLTDAGALTANSFIKAGGTSAQYLMADGSISTGGGSLSTLTLGTGLTGTSFNGSAAVTATVDSSVIPYLTTANTFTGGVQQITTASAATIGLIVKGSASQSADLLSIRNSSNTVIATVDANGVISSKLGIQSGSASFAGVSYNGISNPTGATTLPTLIVKGITSQTANLTEWQDSSANILTNIAPSGNIETTSGMRFYTSAARSGWSTLANTGGNLSFNYQFALTDRFSVTAGASTTVAAIIKGAVSQSANLQEWQQSDASIPTAIDSVGKMRIRTFGFMAGGSLDVSTASTTNAGIVVRGVASQTADLQVWQDSTATALAQVTSGGFMNATGYRQIGGNTNAFGASTISGTVTAFGPGGNAAIIPVTIRGAASQTADLQQWQDSSANILARINATGNIVSSTASYFGTTTLFNSTLNVQPLVTNWSGIAIRGLASQTGNLQEWQISSGVVMSLIDSYGRMGFNTSSLPNSTGAYSILSIGNNNTVNTNLTIKSYASQTANLQEWQDSAGSVLAKLSVSGTFSAVAKSFDIPHPTKSNMRLRYGSIEGPENGVYVRGNTQKNIIELPEYWTELVDESTITVSLTSVGKFQKVYVQKIENNKIYIGGRIKNISYVIFGERKDIDKLIVEY